LVKRFGALVATDHVSFDLSPGQIHALIGPNGAGKSTLVNLISGLLTPDEGELTLDGVRLTGLAPHQRVRAGLSRCFQVSSIFRELTVLDNLLLAVQANSGSSFKFLKPREHAHDLLAQAMALGERVRLGPVTHHVAGTLPHGAQRKLDVALALASRPKLLLLDEPMAGMGPAESAEMVELIASLKADMALLLIEHDMNAVFELADQISVLVYGRVLTSGTAHDIKTNPQVQEVYLGTEATAKEMSI
jgi:branched-chain amino acid transport system ATP-binding protein